MNLIELVDTTAHEETRRIMQICNACRYCEGFCAVFPAMERRRTFDVGDTAYLANLCHNCGSCFHSCQYAPPHEFGINVPQTLSERRTQSYEDYAWPPAVSRIFRHNGLIVTLIVCLVLSACVGAMLALISPHLFWGIHVGEGAFYVLVPHTVMAGIPLAISSFVVLSFIMGWRRYWQQTGAQWGGITSFIDAIRASATLRYLGGNNAGTNEGCPSPDDRPTNARKYYHHLTFYGFMLCFASTSTGTIYHYVFGREAPYGYFELPVLLGTVGGIILCIGTAGLWHEKQRMDERVKSLKTLGMDYAFIGILFAVSFTGLVLLALRETSFMGLTLAVHLGFVHGFFLILPFSNFVHGLYRFAALLAHSQESQQL